MSLDPELRGRLEGERDFLLASLDDLDAELAAGDIDESDHRALADDYTSRAATVLEAIDTERAPRGPNTANEGASPSRRRRVLTVLGVVAVAALAGWVLAQAVGTRRPNDVASGEIRQTIRNDLADALVLSRTDFDGADGLYGAVLDREPSNAEALTYRGWMYVRSERSAAEVTQGAEWIEAAIAIEPHYSDALVFSSAALAKQGDLDAACVRLEEFDRSSPPPAMTSLVASLGLRRAMSGLAPALDQRLQDAATKSPPVAALEDYESIIDDYPENSIAPVERSFLLYQAGVSDADADRGEETKRLAREGLEAAAALEPDRPDAHARLALVYTFEQDFEAAQAALDAFDDGPARPCIKGGLEAELERNNVRTQLEEAESN